MFRTTVLSIVLTLTVGQNAWLLCKWWCDPHRAAATGCHDKESSEGVRLVTGNSCDDAPRSYVASLRDEVRRSASDSHTDYAAVVPRYQFTPSISDGRPDQEPGHLPSRENRPFVTVLRI